MESAAAMSSSDRFIDCYEAIAVATRRMLDAARAADWPAFAAGERECRTWIEHIERLGNPDALLDAAARRRRMELLRSVLRDDAALREVLSPWLGQVDRCMHGRPAAQAC